MSNKVRDKISREDMPNLEELEVIRSSPFWVSKAIHEKARDLDFDAIILRAPVHSKSDLSESGRGVRIPSKVPQRQGFKVPIIGETGDIEQRAGALMSIDQI